MNKTIFFLLVASIFMPQLLSMQSTVAQINSGAPGLRIDKESSEKVGTITRILFSSDRGSIDAVIAAIMKSLNDISSSYAVSKKVKDALISELLSKPVEVLSSSRPINSLDCCESLIKIYCDGTRSVEDVEHIYPLDRDVRTVIQEKPESPWYQLSFEEFLRIYLTQHHGQNSQPGSVNVPARAVSPKA